MSENRPNSLKWADSQRISCMGLKTPIDNKLLQEVGPEDYPRCACTLFRISFSGMAICADCGRNTFVISYWMRFGWLDTPTKEKRPREKKTP